MKSFYISILIIILLLSCWLYIHNYLNNTVEELTKGLAKLETHIIKENWKEAKILYRDIDGKWKGATKILMLVIDHEEMEEVNFSLSQIESYLRIEDISSLMGEVGSLRFLINHVKEKDSLSLDNIF